MKLKKVELIDIIVNSTWVLIYFLIPIIITLNSQEESSNSLGLFLTSLVFGKFFWDAILPSFGEAKSFRNKIWMIIWGPIANLISGILVVKVVTFLLDKLFIFVLSDNIIKSINFGLNFLSDIWMLPSSKIETEYQFSIGLVVIVIIILQMRILPLYMVGWKKIILNLGILALILRTIKYVGGDFENILNIGNGYFKDNYSYISIITIVLGWLIAIMIEKLKKKV